jgi:plasmid stabilization system protein ParE
MKLLFHAMARRELLDALRWYEQQSDDASSGFAVAVDAAIDRICADPERYEIVLRRFQRAKVERYPYNLFYELVADNCVRIMAVAHTSRRAGYWRRRK